MNKLDFVVGHDLAGERLDRAIARMEPSFSNTRAKKLVETGAVSVDGQVAWRASLSLTPGQHVTASVLGDDVEGAPDLRGAVIYRDQWLIAICKPSGLPTHETHDPAREHALGAVKRLLRDGPTEPYLAVHHRLDVQTSGVLLFAIDRAANKGLADAFANRTVHKSYLALVDATDLSGSFTVDNQLGRMRHDTRRFGEVKRGDSATTVFEVLARSPLGTLVQARPRTGRTHQIRVHLQGVASPILGDELYGGSLMVGQLQVARVMLHAHQLELPHPVTGEPLSLAAEPPEDFSTLAEELGLGGGWKRT